MTRMFRTDARSGGAGFRRRFCWDGSRPASGGRAKTPSQALLENWNDIGKRLVTMAEDWPADKYYYKLTPATRSFRQVLLHIAGSNYDLLNRM